MACVVSLAEVDSCQTSIDILREKCTKFLVDEMGATRIWFPDHCEPYPAASGIEELTDVVFFGRFAQKFLESGNWLGHDFRLWTLCRAARDVLIQLYKIPAAKIGIIPRYRLFPASPSSAVKAPPVDESIIGRNFVFAGRISPTKNIEALLLSISDLQVNYRRRVTLDLFGSFDSEPHPDRGRRARPDYQEVIRDLVQRLPWVTAPTFHGKVEPDAWLRDDWASPCFISLSTFACEDFGVSLAQAQSAGWPAWLSDWGGHRDAIGKIRRFSISAIGRSGEPEAIVRTKSKILAQCFDAIWPSATPSYAAAPPFGLAYIEALQPPENVALTEIDRWRRAAIDEYLPGIHFFYRDASDGMEFFADTPQGRLFLSRYRMSFADPSPNVQTVVLYDERYPEGLAWLDCPQFSELKDCGSFALIAMRDLFSKESAALVFSAREVVALFCSPALARWVELWSCQLDLDRKISLQLPLARDYPGLAEIRKFLRCDDSIHFHSWGGSAYVG